MVVTPSREYSRVRGQIAELGKADCIFDIKVGLLKKIQFQVTKISVKNSEFLKFSSEENMDDMPRMVAVDTGKINSKYIIDIGSRNVTFSSKIDAAVDLREKECMIIF